MVDYYRLFHLFLDRPLTRSTVSVDGGVNLVA